MIKPPIQFVYVFVGDLLEICFILNAFRCAFLAFCFQVSKTQLLLLRLFVGFVDFKFKFYSEF